jgi:hypothetical protein
VKERRARGEGGLAVTAMIGVVAAAGGEDEALTGALDGASTVQNKSLEEMRLVRG